MSDYWVQGWTREMVEELKKLGAYYVVSKKRMRVDSIVRTGTSYAILKALGVKLTKVKQGSVMYTAKEDEEHLKRQAGVERKRRLRVVKYAKELFLKMDVPFEKCIILSERINEKSRNYLQGR